MMPGPYAIRNYRMEIVAAVTNKVPSGAYRGFGAPQATFVIERLLDRLAARLRLDRADVRRRNLIPADAMPYESITQHHYDSGDYRQAFERLLELVDYPGFHSRQDEASKEGRYLGIGIVPFVMAAGLAPSRILGPAGVAYGNYETAVVRMDPSGKVTIFTGASSQGQGSADHAGAGLRRAARSRPRARRRRRPGRQRAHPVQPGRSDREPSRRRRRAGGAPRIGQARRQAVPDRSAPPRGKRIGHRTGRRSRIPARLAGHGLDIAELAREAHRGHNLPDEIPPTSKRRICLARRQATTRSALTQRSSRSTPKTGKFEIVRYVVVNDSGTLINPTIVEGQIYGGVVQGIGSAKLEELVYDDAGQLQTMSFMDYLLPTSADVPEIELELRETPAPQVPGGMKGAGEIGILPPTAASQTRSSTHSPLRRRGRRAAFRPEPHLATHRQSACPQ